MKWIILPTVLLSLSGTVIAGSLDVEKSTSVVFVNGNKLEKDQVAETMPGNNQLIVTFEKSYGNNGSKDLFSSKPYIVSFSLGSDTETAMVAAPKTYSVTHAESVFQKTPKWVVSVNGNPIPSTTEILQGKEGLAPYWDIEGLVEDYNIDNNISFVPAAVTVAAASGIASAPNKNKASPKKDKKQKPSQAKAHPQALEQMQAWYLKASKQERKEFRKWMIDQE